MLGLMIRVMKILQMGLRDVGEASCSSGLGGRPQGYGLVEVLLLLGNRLRVVVLRVRHDPTMERRMMLPIL